MIILNNKHVFAQVGRTWFKELGSKPRHLLPCVIPYTGGIGFNFLLWELFIIVGKG